MIPSIKRKSQSTLNTFDIGMQHVLHEGLFLQMPSQEYQKLNASKTPSDLNRGNLGGVHYTQWILVSVLHSLATLRRFSIFSPNTTQAITMQVKVKTLTGRDIPVDVESSDKVIRIKEMMEEKEGIPPAQQRLIFNGSQLNDEITIEESGIQAGASLHLVLTLRGGC